MVCIFSRFKNTEQISILCIRRRASIQGLGKFGTQLNLNTDTVGGIKVGCTSHKELENIVHFLDHETAKIDTLIAKQQELIKLLKEKRQAVISHAVTKGLNPNAPMRDSGVEWLGEVPAHWGVLPLKHLASLVGTGGTPKVESSFSEEPEVNWFTPEILVNQYLYRLRQNM
jgi:type I restriction enzyme S subunit